MEFRKYIGKVVVSTTTQKRYVLTKVTAAEICVETTEVNSSGYTEHYLWETFNGDPFAIGQLVFEDESLNEPFKQEYAAYTKSEKGRWESYHYDFLKD